MRKAQYTPPTPTRADATQLSRRRCVRNSQLVGDSLDESEYICRQRSRVASCDRCEQCEVNVITLFEAVNLWPVYAMDGIIILMKVAFYGRLALSPWWHLMPSCRKCRLIKVHDYIINSAQLCETRWSEFIQVLQATFIFTSVKVGSLY